MDPLVKIVSDLHDWIVLHFNGKDFKKVTEVSPSWNAKLENSKLLTDYVKLSIETPGWSNGENISNILNNSTRRYRNVSVNFQSAPQISPLELMEYLVASASILLELEIKNLKGSQKMVERLLDEIDLSKLKVLKLREVTTENISKLLNRCNSVTKLELKSSSACLLNIVPPSISIPQLRPFLIRNGNLQEVELAGFEIYKVFFEAGISEAFVMELRRLKWGADMYGYRGFMPHDTERLFVEFLETQSQHLKYLEVDTVESFAIEQIINKMPALTCLSMNWLIENEAQLNLNENIFELSIASFENHRGFIKILQAVPNLKKLTLGTLKYKEILASIARNLQQLSTLRIVDSQVRVDDPIWTSLWPDAVPFSDESMPFGLRTFSFKQGWSLKRRAKTFQ